MRSISEELRHYVKLLESQQLNEATDYNAMFNDVRRYMQQYLKPEQIPVREQEIINAITNARQALRRDDRIVWFLRLWKLGFLGHMMSTDISKNIYQSFNGMNGNAEKIDAAFDPIYKSYDQFLNAYANKAKSVVPTTTSDNAQTDGNKFYTNSSRVLQHLAHFFSLPIPQIQNFVFNFLDFNRLSSTFEQFEDNWKKQSKELIPYDPNDGQIVLKFDDGFFWFLMNRGACAKEGGAMGHCGNVPSQQSGDRILSLRKFVKQGKETYVRPSLTFILHGDGFLGEMKGRGNQKPKAEYHNHIVSLLKTDLINGIQGGGYAPQNNFSLSDLDKETQEQLLKVKPELGTLIDMYRTEGVTEKLLTQMQKRYGVPLKGQTFTHNNKVYGVLEKYKDVFDFAEDNDAEKRNGVSVKWIASILRDGEWLEVNSGRPDRNIKVEILEDIGDETRRAVGNYIQKEYPNVVAEMPDYDPSSIDDILTAVEEGDISELEDVFYQAYSSGTETGTYSELSNAFWKEIHNNPYVFSDDGSTVVYDKPVVVAANIGEILEVMQDEEEYGYNDTWLNLPGNEEYRVNVSEPQYGFQGYDESAASQAFIDYLPFPLSKYRD